MVTKESSNQYLATEPLKNHWNYIGPLKHGFNSPVIWFLIFINLFKTFPTQNKPNIINKLISHFLINVFFRIIDGARVKEVSYSQWLIDGAREQILNCVTYQFWAWNNFIISPSSVWFNPMSFHSDNFRQGSTDSSVLRSITDKLLQWSMNRRYRLLMFVDPCLFRNSDWIITFCLLSFPLLG